MSVPSISPTQWTSHNKKQFGKPKLLHKNICVVINGINHNLGLQVITEQWVEELKERNLHFPSKSLEFNVWFGNGNVPVYVVLRLGREYFSLCPRDENPKCFSCRNPGLKYDKFSSGDFQLSGQFCHGSGYQWLQPNERIEFLIKVSGFQRTPTKHKPSMETLEKFT